MAVTCGVDWVTYATVSYAFDGVTWTELAVLEAPYWTWVRRVNNGGQFAGWYNTAPDEHDYGFVAIPISPAVAAQ
jgi:hypothetical protein